MKTPTQAFKKELEKAFDIDVDIYCVEGKEGGSQRLYAGENESFSITMTEKTLQEVHIFNIEDEYLASYWLSFAYDESIDTMRLQSYFHFYSQDYTDELAMKKFNGLYERKEFIDRPQDMADFIEGDIESPEEEVVYRIVDANGKGPFRNGSEAAKDIVVSHVHIPHPEHLVGISDERDMLFAFNDLEEMIYCCTDLKKEHFRNRTLRIMRIKYTEKVSGCGQCVFTAA